MYLLHSLPAILFPTGILASLLTLLAGVALGLAVAAGALVRRARQAAAAIQYFHACCCCWRMLLMLTLRLCCGAVFMQFWLDLLKSGDV